MVLKDPELTVVIPATKVRSNLETLKYNLTFTKKYNYKLVLVHDIQDSESSGLLKTLLYGFENTLLIEGHYGCAGLARNQAIPHLNTEWIVFWDSDDEVIPNNFLHLFNKIKTEKSLIGIGNFETVDKKEEYILGLNRISKFKKNVVTHPGLWRYIFNRRAIANLEFSNSTYGEDVQFICEVLSKNPQITTTGNPIYRYTINSKTQVTSKVNKKNLNLSTLQSIANLILKGSLDKQNLIFMIFIRQGSSLIKRCELETKIKVISIVINVLYKQKQFSILKSICVTMLVFIRPEIKRFNNGRLKQNSIYLHGGLGNQLFQLSEMLERFSVSEFDVISNSQDIFEKYNLSIPENLPISQNRNFSSKISKIPRKKAINLVLKLNYFIQSDNRILSYTIQIFERCYLYLLEITIFRNYNIVSDIVASRNNSFVGQKPNLFIGYFQFKKNNLSASTISYLKGLLEFDAKIGMVDFRGLSNENCPLIIHVRLGDYKEFENLDVVDDNYFRKAIEVVNPIFEYRKVWLFSNDPVRALKLLPDYLIEKTVVMEDISSNDLDKFQLMRLGQAYIIPNSTFSWWAVRLCENSEPIVIAPRRWFKSQKNPRDLIPNEWILI